MSSTLQVRDAGHETAAYVVALSPFEFSSEVQRINPTLVGDPPVSVLLVADGVSPLFSFEPIEGLREDNVVVTTVAADRTETTREHGVDYILTPFGVIFTTPPANGVEVIIQRVEPLIQPDIYTTNTPFPARETERRLTRIVYGLQHLTERFSRTLRVPLGELRMPQLPVRSARMNRLLGFDARGEFALPPGRPMTGVSSGATGRRLAGAVDAAVGRSILGAASSKDLEALDAAVVKKAGDTMSGNLTINKTAAGLRLRSETPTTRLVRFQTGGNDRFFVGASATAESGSNTGSNLFARRVLDDGTEIDFLVVERNTGRVRIEGSVPLRLPAASPYDNNDAVRKSYMEPFGWTEGGSVGASGSSVIISDVPVGVREIVLNFHQVSTSGTQPIVVQVGAASTFSGTYNSSAFRAGGTVSACANSTTGFLINKHTSATSLSGFLRFTRFSPQAPNVWQVMGQVAIDTVGSFIATTGHCIMPASPLSRIRIMCGGSDVFSGGTFNVLWRE